MYANLTVMSEKNIVSDLKDPQGFLETGSKKAVHFVQTCIVCLTFSFKRYADEAS